MFSAVGDSPACSERLVFFYDYDFKTGVEIVEISPHLVDPVTEAIITLWIMFRGNMRIVCSIRVMSNNGMSGFGTVSVHGLSLVPKPPARMTASMLIPARPRHYHYLSRST